MHGQLAILQRSERHAAGHAERAAAVSLRRGPRERRSQRPELQRLRRHLARAGRLRRAELRRADGRQRPGREHARRPSTPTTPHANHTPTTTTPTTPLRPATRTDRRDGRPRGGPSRRPTGAAPGLSLSARRRSSATACASTRCSCAERSSAIARASQPSRWRRSAASVARPCSVSSTRIRRPSAGSARRAIRPSASRSEIVWVIDCGRTRSASARSPIDLRALAVQAPEHGALGEREAVLGAQPAHQLSEHDAQLAREAGGVDGRTPRPADYISRKTGKLLSLPV